MLLETDDLTFHSYFLLLCKYTGIRIERSPHMGNTVDEVILDAFISAYMKKELVHSQPFVWLTQ